MAKGFSLKDQLFNRDKLVYLAGLFRDSDPSFPADRFVDEVMQDLPALELKQRITLISEVLERFLPTNFTQAAQAIQKALPPPLDPSKTDDDFGDFIFAPLGAYVARRGLGANDLPVAFNLLEELTQRFSVEFDIRAFLNAHPEVTLAQMRQWASHPNYHVRRLVSEGSRPKLPWGQKIHLDTHAPIPLLDELHADPTRYVTRSVANHLNDIAKIDPDLVLHTLGRWQDEARQDPKELGWMTRHALRGLVKKGHPEALALLGFHPNPPIEVVMWAPGAAETGLGEAATLSLKLRANAKAALMIDYVVDMPRPSGRAASKVFKLKQLALSAGEEVLLTKTHRFVKEATTITYYPGPHDLHLQINGTRVATLRINLTP
ncbi:hypothetical protein [Actibacterium pelagium]|uniref:3-methyladenine DNA glycosylase AlkC n=1 Tax=Actibacterium pelagium TaxID=2029103 RepID=A0A917AE46_9RHOB|nr:hypothetical protein [Actibacterium pelagium]GGE46355.1 hypothetical protein GCM10011517_12550 [Actibacterium pelagium]